MKISLRTSLDTDLDVFFENQADEEANQMAAFTAKNPQDKEAYMTKWRKLLKDDSINMQTILLDDKVVGCVVKYVMEGTPEITYAISKAYWGQGITSKAVEQFLEIEKSRPITGRVAFDNIGSQRILEKTGFKKIGEDRFFANARSKEIKEFIYQL